ncbi:hypothetical protein [Ascidiimonas aurantiaca]|uniref:hypothetical protein n=1 Tax=Ascidiimonas aurantiaca TaxID=1685432 RepID=UPI0030EE8373
MIRKIVDHQKLTTEIMNLLVQKFPDGYDDNDIITFRNSKNEVIEAVEVRTDDTIYLVKVGKRLVKALEDFVEDPNDKDDDSSEDLDTENNFEDEE